MTQIDLQTLWTCYRRIVQATRFFGDGNIE